MPRIKRVDGPKKIFLKPKKDGSRTVKWKLDYYDNDGNRHRPEYETRSAADQARTDLEEALRKGLPAGRRASETVKHAGEAWIEDLRAQGRRRVTINRYQQILYDHICDAEFGVGDLRIADLTSPRVEQLRRDMTKFRSLDTAKLVVSHLSMIMNHAQRGGLIESNPAGPIRVRRGVKPKVAIPTPPELRQLLEAITANGPAPTFQQVYLTVDMFTGLRSGEMRALRWRNVKLDAVEPRVLVCESLDRHNVLYPMAKSEAGHREVPLGPNAVQVLRAWKLVCPKEANGKLRLAFPNGSGNFESAGNIYNRIWRPACRDAGLGEWIIRKDGSRYFRCRYKPHALRHAAASLWIEAGGDHKLIQQRVGHASIQQTFDTYGHLWQNRQADQDAAIAAERFVFNAS